MALKAEFLERDAQCQDFYRLYDVFLNADGSESMVYLTIDKLHPSLAFSDSGLLNLEIISATMDYFTSLVVTHFNAPR